MILRSTNIRGALRSRQRGFMLNPFRFGGGPWTPANLASPPRHWYTPATTVTGSTNASAWASAVGGYSLTQGTSGAQPTIEASGINSLRALAWDGNDTLVTTDVDMFRQVTSGWFFAVFKKTALDAGAGSPKSLFFSSIGTSSGSTRLGMDISASTPNRLRVVGRVGDGDGVGTMSSVTLADTDWHMIMVRHDWATDTCEVWFDGDTVTQNALAGAGTTSNTAAAASPSLGALWNGTSILGASDFKFAEFLIGRALPTLTECDKLFGYEAHKFALTARLPFGHPYISNPP
jgi:hypothetical protein